MIIAVIVATVLFLRSKNQDDLDKKTNNHLPLPMDYASNEGTHKNYLSYLFINITANTYNTIPIKIMGIIIKFIYKEHILE